MDRKKLLTLLGEEEGIKLDFKQKIDVHTEYGKKELAKDICAMANSKGGRGYLIVGVEDKTKVLLGIQEQFTFTEEQVQQIIATRCEPPIPIKIDFISLDQKEIGVITIYDGGQKPYQIRETGAFYIRRGSTNDFMRKEELISSFHENLDLILETCPIIRSSIEALNMETVAKYFKRKGIQFTEENKIFLMESASIIAQDRESGKYFCTMGGLLVFSDINSLYMPNNNITIILLEKGTSDKLMVYDGKLIDIIDKCEKKITELLPKQYPRMPVFEALRNAVLYRDYTMMNRGIEITIGCSSIMVVSPGAITYPAIPKDNFRYFRRNAWLYEKVITLDDKERFLQTGNGFAIMKSVFLGKGKVRFINSLNEDVFKVIFPGKSICKK
ncbi:MAG: RNA-binding domain-containing protein [Clostridiaceae bacterium]